MADYTLRTTPTFLDGLMMIATAISDSRLVVEGSDCVYEQPQRALSRHDWRNDLLLPDGRTRIISSATEHVTAALGTESLLLDRLRDVAKRGDAGLLLVAQLPLMKIMGTSLRSVCAALSKEIDIPVCSVSPPFIERDWTDAFHYAMESLAGLVQAQEPPDDDRIALLGYRYSRHEGDCRADVAELKAMLSSLGLKAGPLWFTQTTAEQVLDFSAVSRIASFPIADKVAEKLAGRIGRSHSSLPLPLGLSATEAFLRRLGEDTGKAKEADREIDRRLSDAIPRLEWVITRLFTGRRVLVVADIDYLDPLADYLAELGFEIAGKFSRTIRQPENFGKKIDKRDPTRRYDPGHAMLKYHVSEAIGDGGLDLIIGSSWERDAVFEFDVPFFELGYPSMLRHVISDTPALGFRGALTVANRLADLLMESEYNTSRKS